jgi:predicted permease
MTWRSWTDLTSLEVRYAIRRLAKNPAFAIVASLSLALGIGVTTAAFSVLYAVLLRALPVRDPGALVVVSARNPGAQYSMSYPAFTYLRDHASMLEGVVSFRSIPVNVSTAAATERVTGMLVSGNYFGVLGVAMAQGAPILPEDDRTPGAGGARGVVAVLAHQFWTRQFDRNGAVLGRTIRVNGQPVTIVGVAPPDFHGTRIGSLPDIFLPMMFASRVFEMPTWLPNPRNNWLRIMGRLKPGATPAQAQAELTVAYRQFHQDVIVPIADTDAARRRARETSIALEPGYTGLLEMGNTVKPTLYSLMGLVALVFLIACTNVASLMVARAERVHRETAICLALGATRARLWSGHFLETLIVGAIGLCLGLALATSLSGLLAQLLPSGQDLRITVDREVLAVSMCLGALATIVLTAVTARHSTRDGISRALKGESMATRLWLRKALIVGQLGLSVVVLAGAALLVQTVTNLGRVEMGFERNRVLIASIAPGGYSPQQRESFYARILDDVRTIPGVVSAALANDEPLGVRTDWTVTIRRDPAAAPQLLTASVAFISPDYFKTMGIPLVRGRDFTSRDHSDPSRPVIVNENFARTYVTSGDPLGSRITSFNTAYEIIGIARDSASTGLRDLDQQMMYVPGGDGVLFLRDAVLHVRTAVPPVSLQPAIEAVVHRLDPDVPVFNVRTIDQQIERFMVRERTFALLSSTFGLLAIVLCAVGLYGVIANGVNRRTKELGVRLALGAGPRRIFWLVLREAGLLALIGVAAGVPCALLVGRAVRSLLFGVQPGDWRSVSAAVAVLLTVAVVAAWLPARRAARVDPLIALRAE